MVAFVSHTRDRKIPGSETRLNVGDHSFITEESYLVYALAETKYYGEISSSVVSYEERISATVLYRIQSTCLLSVKMSRKMKRIFCEWKGIEYQESFSPGYL